MFLVEQRRLPSQTAKSIRNMSVRAEQAYERNQGRNEQASERARARVRASVCEKERHWQRVRECSYLVQERNGEEE